MKNTEREMSSEKILKVIGTYRDGHTIFENGQHGNGYVTKEGLMRNPSLLKELCTRLAHLYPQESYDFVIGPVNFGAQLAAIVGMQENKPFTMAFVPHDGKSYLPAQGRIHRDFKVNHEERALFIDDWAMSGETVYSYTESLNNLNINVVGVAVIGKVKNIANSIPIKSLVEYPFQRFAANACPSCIEGKEIDFYGIRE